MPSFKVVDDVSNIKLSSSWTGPEKFNSKYRIVGESGKPITASYKGNQYRLILKKERDFTTAERIGRGFLGVVAAVFTLGIVVIFSKRVRKLFTQEKAKIRFAEVVYISSHKLLKNNRVDIAGEASRFFFRSTEQHVSEKLGELIDKKVHEFMTDSAVLCGHMKHIKEKGFQFLDDNILEHPELDGWIMKGGGDVRWSSVSNKAGKARPNKFDNVMRVFMAERMSKVVQEEDLDVVIPEKRLYPSKFESSPGSFHKQYYVFSKKVDILNADETENALRQLPNEQLRKIARDICLLIKRTGFVDAHFGNIRWSPDEGKIAIVDTESLGLLIERTDKSPRFKGTIKKCALIGLQELKDRIGGAIPIFAEEAEKAMKNCKKLFS